MSILRLFQGQSEEEIIGKIADCLEAEFPVCLNEAMLGMFGAKGKKSLDSIVMNETFENTEISSERDIWNLYEKYIERTANILGDDVAKVIEFQCLNQMKSMPCISCPLHERELEKRKIAGLSY